MEVVVVVAPLTPQASSVCYATRSSSASSPSRLRASATVPTGTLYWSITSGCGGAAGSMGGSMRHGRQHGRQSGWRCLDKGSAPTC